MYYLTVKNLDTERCIDMNVEDIYEDDQYYSFLPDFFFVKNRIIKLIKIKCIEMPGSVFKATVYSD
jgi:deoxyadenosine/deoxycytidine kinase